MSKCNSWNNADDAIASLPDFLQASFAAIKAGNGGPSSSELINSRGSCLGLAALERAEKAEAIAATVKPLTHTGRINPSIYVGKGDPLSMWHVNDMVEVVIRHGNGYEHFGKLAAPLNAEGSFHQAADPEEEAFRRLVYDNFVLPERDLDFTTNEAGEQVTLSRGHDRNYTHRATCLWRSRNYAGAPHSRAFLIVAWKAFNDGRQYPDEALLMDGDKVWSFKMQREQSGGNRPQWKGRAA